MNRQKIYFTLIVALCFLVLPIQSYAFKKEDKIYKNIYIEGIDISNLTKEEAIEKLEAIIYESENINFIYKEKIFPLNLQNIDLSYNIENMVLKAFKVEKNNDFIKNTKTKLNLNLGNKISFCLSAKYDKQKLNEFINNIYKDIETKPVDAKIKINNEKIEIINEINGVVLDTEKLNKIIVEKLKYRNYEEVCIPIYVVKPKYTFDKLSKINTVLGRYETKFNSSNYNRSNNIWLAANKINNILLDTQEEFSFNNITGKRNIEEGFKEAPIIINGELRKGVGGGICQVSSTVYNAALYSGLEITQSRNHSIPSAYIQKGRDATVAYGSVDLRFKNVYEYPVLIQNKIENNKIISIIYGNNSYKQDIDIVTDITDVIPNNIIVKNDNSMYENEKYIKEKGRKGYKVRTYRIYKNKNGETLKSELINESYYPPMNKIIIKGTKPKTQVLMI